MDDVDPSGISSWISQTMGSAWIHGNQWHQCHHHCNPFGHPAWDQVSNSNDGYPLEWRSWREHWDQICSHWNQRWDINQDGSIKYIMQWGSNVSIKTSIKACWGKKRNEWWSKGVEGSGENVCDISVAIDQPKLGKSYPPASLPYHQQWPVFQSSLGNMVTIIWCII